MQPASAFKSNEHRRQHIQGIYHVFVCKYNATLSMRIFGHAEKTFENILENCHRTTQCLCDIEDYVTLIGIPEIQQIAQETQFGYSNSYGNDTTDALPTKKSRWDEGKFNQVYTDLSASTLFLLNNEALIPHTPKKRSKRVLSLSSLT